MTGFGQTEQRSVTGVYVVSSGGEPSGQICLNKANFVSERIGARGSSPSPFLDFAFSHCSMLLRAAEDSGVNRGGSDRRSRAGG